MRQKPARQKPAKFFVVPKAAEKSAKQKFVKQIKGGWENALKIYAAPAGGKRQEQEQIPAGASLPSSPRVGVALLAASKRRRIRMLFFFSISIIFSFCKYAWARWQKLKDIGPTD